MFMNMIAAFTIGPIGYKIHFYDRHYNWINRRMAMEGPEFKERNVLSFEVNNRFQNCHTQYIHRCLLCRREPL